MLRGQVTVNLRALTALLAQAETALDGMVLDLVVSGAPMPLAEAWTGNARILLRAMQMQANRLLQRAAAN